MKCILLCVFVATGLVVHVHASSSTIDPLLPVSGQPVTITYDPTGGPLAGAGTVYIHKGENGWNNVQDVAMTLSNGLWYATYPVPEGTYQLNFVFWDLAGTWDNNNYQDWNFRVGTAGAGGVMMQGFYWDCPQGWYSTMTANAPDVRNMRGGYGIDRIWFPAPSKADGGGFSMGYDPYDYYDLGQYNQQGSIPTRFGTQSALKSAIAAYTNVGVVCMADMVLNHRSGGASEANPNTGGTSYTDFSGVASGECTWHYNEFHPSTYEAFDPGAFEGFPDICHVTANLPGSANYDLIEWGNWLMDPANAGFDGGWRFDYPKGIHASFIGSFRAGTGNNFGILEYWDTNISLIESYVNGSGTTAAFDFPAFYTMRDVFNYNQHIGRLIDDTRIYAAKDPANAVMFVANHDTDKDAFVEDIGDKMLAYAYILTYKGYPCIFWKDYFDYGLADLGGQSGNGIDPLVWVRGALGGGQPDIEVLKADSSDLLIYGTRNGSMDAPGYIVVLNNSDSSTQSASVTTADSFLHGKDLECHAWYSYVTGQNVQPANTTCSAGGTVTVQAPPRGYTVYSVDTSLPTPPWTTKDVGATGQEGRADYYSETYRIAGSGSDIGGTEDLFRYVYRVTSGDCGIQARVLSISETDSASKAGVMIRKGTLSSGANINAAVLVTPEDGVVFQWRSADDDATGSSTVPGVEPPCWVRLVQSGGECRGYYSLDGSGWTQIGSAQTVPLPASTRTGLAVTAGDSNKVAIAAIDEVSVNLAPVLPEIDDEVLVAGNTLTITNIAIDAESPPQILTYSLSSAPAGASIGLTNGIFEWRPQMVQSPSTQSVSVVVSDDGLPALSSTRSFSIDVHQPAMPGITSPTITNDMFSFWISGDAGPDYSVLYATNLAEGIWMQVYTTNSPTLPFFWSSPTSGVDHEFFKVELGP